MLSITKLGINVLSRVAKRLKASLVYKGYDIPFKEKFGDLNFKGAGAGHGTHYSVSYRVFVWDWEFGLVEVFTSSGSDAKPLWSSIKDILDYEGEIADRTVAKSISHIGILKDEYQDPGDGGNSTLTLDVYRFNERLLNRFFEGLVKA